MKAKSPNSDRLDKKITSHWQKILLVLYEMTVKSQSPAKYEDIVVGVFKRYPETFHLRGYKKYPDSSSVHKRLYDMKPLGLVKSNQSTFSLTNKGKKVAEGFETNSGREKRKRYKAPRNVDKEIKRITSSESFSLFKKGEKDKILDTDFFWYLGASARSSRNEFLNRIEELNYIVRSSEEFYPKKLSGILINYHEFMLDKFGLIVKEISNRDN